MNKLPCLCASILPAILRFPYPVTPEQTSVCQDQLLPLLQNKSYLHPLTGHIVHRKRNKTLPDHAEGLFYRYNIIRQSLPQTPLALTVTSKNKSKRQRYSFIMSKSKNKFTTKNPGLHQRENHTFPTLPRFLMVNPSGYPIQIILQE